MLEVLDLAGTNLEMVPASLGNCRRLRELDLSEARVTALPETIINCKHLETIRVPTINVLPTSIAHIDRWEVISDIPDEDAGEDEALYEEDDDEDDDEPANRDSDEDE